MHKFNNSSIKTEIIAGTTTFLASMYIIIVNPSIISNTGMPFSAVLTATVLVSSLSSICMGIYAKNPILIAPGMGLNAFFTYSVVIGMKIPWETALGTVFWAGIIFLALSVFNIRTYILNAIPKQLRYGTAAGIGIFITLIGFTKANFIIANKNTILGVGELNPITITFLAGLFITAVMAAKKIPGSLILGIIITTVLSIPIGRLWGNAETINHGINTLVSWSGFFSWPDFSLFFKCDLTGSLKFGMLPVIFVFLFTDLFDSLSTFIGVAEAGDLTDEKGEPRNIRQSLIVDAFATTISGIFGTSSGTSYIESAAGIKEGGKTGVTAITAGLLFLPFMFFSPFLSIVPDIATAPALVLVGVFMMKPVLKIHWENFDDAFPSFLALILIPLTYSITEGIIWSFLSWTILKLAMGKKEEISKTLLIIDVFAIISLLM